MLNYTRKVIDRATYSQGRPDRSRGRPARATPEQIEAWRALARAYTAVLRRQEQALAGRELDISEYDVLVTLAQGPPEGLRPSELAERVLLTRSGMTRLIDRLEERGSIERRECPSDHRGQLVALTPAGRRGLRRAAPGLLRGLGGALALLSPSELAALRRATERITEATTAHSPE